MGTWYGYASFGTESIQGKGKCVTARYSYNTSLQHVDVYNWQIPSPGYRSSINGSAVPMNPDLRQGHLKVTFVISDNATKTFPLHILDTDYDRWAVVYFCRDLLHHHETSGWILTRDQNLDKMKDRKVILRKVEKVLKNARLETSKYTKTVQQNCAASTQ
ncbi:lazarillo protein-like [Macrosteles quadrilineatus]|uniref:lazarillo protein-like n=1 Tax=Macrosteles quadrilineatus TaxID=74068 RepID=UPI0023E127C0|nr:lazarillo protein-like [Macrosteles quadrilineatus]